MGKQVFEKSQEPSHSAVRVTPKEFAEAVAAIESRRSGPSPATDSVNIDDAIHQLGLTVSPDEVLTIVETRRAEAQRAIEERQSRKRRIARIAGRAFVTVSILLNLYLLSILSPSRRPQPAESAYTQSGVVHILMGKSGRVYFPFPYSTPPNVELKLDNMNKTTVKNVTESYFDWDNSGSDDFFNSGDVSWTSSGVR